LSVTDLSDQLKKLALMLKQMPREHSNWEEFLRDMDLDAEPSNKQVLNLMKQIVVQLQDQHMDM
jgi:hypothetical protein